MQLNIDLLAQTISNDLKIETQPLKCCGFPICQRKMVSCTDMSQSDPNP